MLKVFLIFLLFNFSNVYSLNKLCSPKLIKNYKKIENKLKICDPGDKIIVNFNFNLQKEVLIAQICDLRFNVISSNENSNINLKNTSSTFVCIFKPTYKK